MVHALASLLALLLLGETTVALLEVPVPGAALGLAGLAATFALRGSAHEEMTRLFDAIAPNVPLLFVPAAVGVVANLDILALFWAHFAVAVVLGTSVTMVVSGFCAQALLRRLEAPLAS